MNELSLWIDQEYYKILLHERENNFGYMHENNQEVYILLFLLRALYYFY